MAGDVIGRGSYELDADLTKVKSGLKEADSAVKTSGEATEAAFAKTGKRSGTLLATGVAQGAKVGAAGAALAFGAATKGGIELENVMARYQATTGATAAEAKRAGLAINRIAGDNRLSLEEVAGAAEKVHNDLGLTGDAADEATAAFAKYGRVTRQDAGEAVSAFDDILDSWGLTAKDANSLMDQLIVSQQKFGGSVTENQATLAALAPAMKAANFQIGDAVELLNLFGAKGLSANMASAAFSKALTKVKSPEELKSLINDISTTSDGFERARKAGDLFGAKAGAKLGNALAGAHLDDYAVSADDAAGALDKAANALDSTFSAQIQKKISQAGAAVRQFGVDVGPAVTGLASLASIASALKIDVGIEKAFSALAGSGPVKAAIGAAGLAAGAVYTAAATVAETLTAPVTMMWTKVAASPAVMAAAGAAGGAAGKIMAAGVGAGIAVGAAAIADQVSPSIDKAGSDIGQHIRDSLNVHIKGFEGVNIGSPKDWPWPLGNKGAPDWAKFSNEAEEGAGKVADGVAQGFRDHASTELKDVGHDAGETLMTATRDGAAKEAPRTATTISDTLWKEMVSHAPRVAASIGDTMAVEMASHSTKWIESARQSGNRAMEGVAQGIVQKRAAPVDALDTLRQMLKDAMSPAKEDARLIGELTSTALAKGLKSKDPAVRAQAEFAKQTIIDRLNELPPTSFTKGSKAAAELARALKSKDPDVRSAAQHVKGVVEANIKPDTYAYGAGATTKFAFGLSDPAAIAKVRHQAAIVSQVVRNYLQQSSPAKEGALSEMGGTFGWGKKAGELFASGLLASGSSVDSAFASMMGGPSSGTLAGALGRGGMALSIGGTARVEFSLSADAAKALKAAGYSETEVAGALRAGVDLSDLANTFRHVASMRSA